MFDNREEVNWNGKGQWAKELRVMRGEDSLSLRIVYPLAVKYRFIDELLHHLVATINKSALLSFIARLDHSPELPLLTLYCTFSLNNPTKNNIQTHNATPVSTLLVLPDLIYHKILLLCEAYTIEHSPLAKGYELIEFISSRAE